MGGLVDRRSAHFSPYFLPDHEAAERAPSASADAGLRAAGFTLHMEFMRKILPVTSVVKMARLIVSISIYWSSCEDGPDA